MLGKLKKIKDNLSNYIYPITVSEAVYVNETKNLKTKLEEMDSAISNAGANTNVTPLAEQITGVYLDPPRLNIKVNTSMGMEITPISGQKIYIYHLNKVSSYLLPAITIPNSSALRINVSNGTFRAVTEANLLSNEVTLIRNVNGKGITGELLPYINNVNKEDVPILTPKDYGYFTFSGGLQSIVFVGDELWFCDDSDDTHTTTASITRRDPNNNFAVLGSFTHNFGHMNTTDYNEEIDCFLMGNGSKDYALPLKGWIFLNASQWVSQTNLDFNSVEKVELDFTQITEAKAQLIWGDRNRGNHNILYLITDDNCKVRKIVLGKGLNNLGSGVYVDGKSATEYNGSYKIVGEWSQTDGGGVNQGAVYHNGVIYTATNGRNGDDLMGGVLYKFKLCMNGVIQKEAIYIPFYKDDGTAVDLIGEGIDIKDGKIYTAYESAPSILTWFDVI